MKVNKSHCSWSCLCEFRGELLRPTILKLGCQNFRSYRALVLNFSSRFVVFYGKNGAGKTNLLEAISLFSSDRGLRKAAVSDFNNYHSKSCSWHIDLLTQKDGYGTFLSTEAVQGRRIAKIDGDLAANLYSLEEVIWLLWITPAMNNLFIGPKNDRRNFFDHLVSGFDQRYKNRLRKISLLQKERLRVLSFQKDENWLTALEQKIAEESVLITKTRFEFLKILTKTLNDSNSEFLNPKVSISGELEEIVEKNCEENAILEVTHALKNARNEDFEKQTTKISVNKSSWLVFHPKTQFESESCSTGEQKAFLISLILAISKIYQKSKRGIPVLLLDDLMVYLDKRRRKILLDELISLNIQTFFTGTELYLFEDISSVAQIYHVENSICSEEKFPVLTKN